MGDFTQALLLPDITSPSDATLKSLALFWDRIYVPEYVERLLSEPGEHASAHRSEAFAELQDAGAIVVAERQAELPPIGDLVRALVEDAELADELAQMTVKGVLPWPAERMHERRAVLDKVAELAADLYLNRVRDALRVSQEGNLAPLGFSGLSAIGCLLGAADAEMPRRDVALLTTSIQAITLPPDVPVEHIIRFRTRQAAELGRFRAAMSDLATTLADDGPPNSLIWKAHDTYRNRVLPALAQLEDALKAGRLRFVVRSLAGATSLSLSPIAPTVAGEGGIQLIGQTLSYRFSRKELLSAHPYSYLYLVGREFRRHGGMLLDPSDELRITTTSPEHAIRRAMVQSIGPERFYPACVFSLDVRASRSGRGLHRLVAPDSRSE